MRHLLLALAVVALGCEKRQMTPWTDVAAPGIEISIEHASSGTDSVLAWGVAHVGGRTLRGKPAFDAVRAKLGDDPKQLAALAIVFLDDNSADAQLWTHAVGGSYPPGQEAIATLPRLTGETLEYWRFARQTADLLRCRVSLEVGTVTCERGGDVAHAEQLAKDPAAFAAQELASSDAQVRIQGIRDLGTLGTDAARTQLIALAQGGILGGERSAAITALGKLGGTGAVEALTRSLLHDGFADARAAAAEALGNLHDQAARPALEQARDHDADAGVFRLATEALKKL